MGGAVLRCAIGGNAVPVTHTGKTPRLGKRSASTGEAGETVLVVVTGAC